MVTIKVACPKCGQRVSGDETFYGRIVPCPLCGTDIVFPKEGEPVPPLPDRPSSEPAAPDRGKTSPGSRREPESSAPAIEPKSKAGSPRESKIAPEKRFAERKPAAAPAARAPVPSGAPARTAEGAPSPTSPAKGPPSASGAALWSLILGIAAFALCPIGPLLALPAIVCGHTGRGNIQRSLGRLGGMGMASAGLMLGYGYLLILVALLLFAPWRVIGSHWAQGFNERTATEIVEALRGYAETNNGRFPAALEDLVPDHMPAAELAAAQWIDPGSVPFLKRANYLYYPGYDSADDPRTILLSAPEPDGAYRRLVAYLDGAVEILPEEDFIRRTAP